MAKVLTEEMQNTLEVLKASYDMLIKNKEACEKNPKVTPSALKQLNDEVETTLIEIERIDPDTANSLRQGKTVTMKKINTGQDLFDDDDLFSILSNNVNTYDTSTLNVEDIVVNDDEETVMQNNENHDEENDNVEEETVTEKIVEAKASMFSNADPMLQYDIIELPSNGQPYKDKTDRLPVGFLTAYDENFITSPNLYKDGMVIDFLLKHKVMNKDFNVENLVSGDVDAIILWLRATSYGYEFPVTVKDPETGENIDYVVDLSTLKPKPFDLVADENGWFDFTLPLTKKVVKFRYLTRKMEKQLKKISELEGYGTKAALLEGEIRSLTASIVGDDVISNSEKKDVQKAIKSLQEWVNKLKKKQNNGFNKFITNILHMQVMSIDGVTDRDKLKEMVNNMPARDSLELRRYINEHTPGIDFEIEIPRPESLGGGSFTTFLNWDDSVFLNLPQLREGA